MTIFEMTEQNMADNGYDAYAYFRQQHADQLLATTPVTETEIEQTCPNCGQPDPVLLLNSAGVTCCQFCDDGDSATALERSVEMIAQPATSSKRTYTPEQQAKRNEQRRARRAGGKAN